MKKNQSLLWILVIFLLIFNIIGLIKNNSYKNDFKALTEKLNILAIKELKQSYILKKHGIIQQNIEAIFFPDIKLKMVNRQEAIDLSYIMKNTQPILFFRFNETSCDACIQEALRLLNNIPKQIPNVRIVILSGYKNVRQFYAFANEENEMFDVYNIDSLPLPIDNLEDPYFFVITKDFKITNVFIPLKEDIQYTKDYLNCIANKYWSDSVTFKKQ